MALPPGHRAAGFPYGTNWFRFSCHFLRHRLDWKLLESCYACELGRWAAVRLAKAIVLSAGAGAKKARRQALAHSPRGFAQSAWREMANDGAGRVIVSSSSQPISTVPHRLQRNRSEPEQVAR